MKWKQIIYKISIYTLATMLALGMMQGYQPEELSLFACTSVADCDAQLSEIADNIKSAEDDIKQRKDDEAALLEQVTAYNAQLELTSEKIETIQSVLIHLAEDIKTKEAEIAQKDHVIINQFKMQQKQLNGLTFLKLLLSATSISDFTMRWSALEVISGKEKSVLDEFVKIKAEIEEDKVRQEEQKADLEATKVEVTNLKAEKEELIVAVHAEMERRQQELDQYEVSADDLARQREIMNRPPPPRPTPPSGGGSGGESGDSAEIPPSEGGWSLPVAPGAVVSTHFGEYYEYSPNPHAGTDIAARMGAPIYSMADGYVLYAGWDPAIFGNVVFVGHNIDGTNYVSMYAHLSSRNVSEGDYVYGGSTVLGGMGNTGYSFGPHLHLELAVRDYYTFNRATRDATNINPLSKLNWRGSYRDGL